MIIRKKKINKKERLTVGKLRNNFKQINEKTVIQENREKTEDLIEKTKRKKNVLFIKYKEGNLYLNSYAPPKTKEEAANFIIALNKEKVWILKDSIPQIKKWITKVRNDKILTKKKILDCI